jgi:alanine dehydrogenase
MDAFCAVRDITSVKVYSPNADNARRYAEEIGAKHGVQCELAPSAREAVRGADIVSCCTSSIEPVFETAWLEPGMHVTDVTPDETQPHFRTTVDVALRPGDYTPYLESLPAEASYAAHGFLGYIAGQPEEQALVPHRTLPVEIATMPTLPQLLAGKTPARASAEQTTWFLNMGAIGVQFEAVAASVYREAVKQGLGHEIPTDWFLQDVRD